MRFKVDYTRDKYFGDILDTDDVDLDEFEGDEDKAMALFSYIVMHTLEVAEARNLENPFDYITVEEIYGSDDSGDSVEPVGNLMEVCRKLVIMCAIEYDEIDRFLACVSNQGWEWFDFDNRHWADDVRYEVDEGDYESVAKEYMDDMGEGLEDRYAKHFDYDAYGQELVRDEYEEIVFNGTMYVMTA
jgi:hypothetical protein